MSADNRNSNADGIRIVEYLDKYALPVPHDDGRMERSYIEGENNAEVKIIWEDESILYTLLTKWEPVEALKMAVSVE